MKTTSLPIRQCNINTMIVDSEITEGKLFQHDKDLAYQKAMIKAGFKAFADGTEEHPYLIFDVEDLLQLKKEVDAGDSKKGKCYRLVWDIYMDDVVWTGIGTKNGDAPKNPFSGTYDGNGKTIYNFTIPCIRGGDNEQYGFIRTAVGATIKNLTINVNGIAKIASDGKLVTNADKVGGAALVGIVKDGITIENCIANGNIGTSEVAAGHTAAGLICYISTSTIKTQLYPRITIKNCVNNVNIVGSRKVGGFIGYSIATTEITDSVNNGNITRSNDMPTKTDDGIGAIFGYDDNNPADYGPLILKNFKNTGVITNNSPAMTYNGLLFSKNGSHYSGSIPICEHTTAENVQCRSDFIVTNRWPAGRMTNMHVSYGKFTDGSKKNVLLGAPTANSEWKVMIPDTDEKIILSSGYIILNEEFVPAANRGKMPVYKADGTTKITGVLQSGTTYKYTA